MNNLSLYLWLGIVGKSRVPQTEGLSLPLDECSDTKSVVASSLNGSMGNAEFAFRCVSTRQVDLPWPAGQRNVRCPNCVKQNREVGEVLGTIDGVVRLGTDVQKDIIIIIIMLPKEPDTHHIHRVARGFF